MIQITKYAVPKKNNGTSSNNSGFANVTNNNTTVINGGDILVDSELSTTSTNAVQNAVITNAINQTISALTNTDGTISILKDGRTVTIGSNTWKLDDNDNLSYSGNIISSGATFENLTVTKAAHFFQLIIDEIKSTKGQILVTAANAKLDKVTVRESDGDIFCYWKATDGEKTIYNQFVADDQVICQTFNVGTSSAATQNKFYWYRVYSVGTETIDGELYNYIHLDPNDKDANSNAMPSEGDEIALLGNRTNTDRQAAIIISAYNNQFLDSALQAPSIAQYNGINNFNLNTHRLNVISKGYNSFSGNFTTTAGENLENKFMPYFPINAPFYLYDYTMEEPQATNPIRYNGSNDIYSTPTFLNAGKYKFRVFINSSSLSSSIEITSYGTTYPSSDLAKYSGIGLSSVLGTTGKTMKVGSTTFYEYAATINITANGYYGLNYWENYQIYIPENDEGFETNFSKIEQTNTRITTQVNNINGQISEINQTAEQIEARVDNVSVKIDSGQITLNGNTKVQGDLIVSDAENGFTLTNNNDNNTFIKSQSIGEYADYDSRKKIISIIDDNANTTLTVANAKSSERKPTNTEYFEIKYSNDNVKSYTLTSRQKLKLSAFKNLELVPNGFVALKAYTTSPTKKYVGYFFEGNYTPSTTNFDSKVHLNAITERYTVHSPNNLGYWVKVNENLMSAHIYSINTRISIYNSSNVEVAYRQLTGNTPSLNFEWTAPSDGDYYIRTESTIRFNTMQNDDVAKDGTTTRRMDYVFRDYVSLKFTFTSELEMNSQDINNIIGYDGIALSLGNTDGNNNIVYIGKDSTHIKYGFNELYISENGIKKYAGSTASKYADEATQTDSGLSSYKAEYAPLNGCVVRELEQASTYYLQPRDELITFHKTARGNATFYLGDPTAPSNVGRKVYMKVYSNNNYIIVRGRGNGARDLIQSAGRSTSETYEVNDRGAMFVSDGYYWIIYVSY